MSPLPLSLGGWLTFQSCSSQPPTARIIAGHTQNFAGVPHGVPATRAEHYCSYCHGLGLAGGANAEPSCYTCHGKTWSDSKSAYLDTAAPATHTVNNAKAGRSFLHHPDLITNTSTCATSACHGEGLGGVELKAEGVLRPGCELCHGRLWESRAQTDSQ